MASKKPRSRSPAGPPEGAVAAVLERFAADRLGEVLPRQRWFGSKGRRIVGIVPREAAPFGAVAPGAWLLLVDVAFERGAGETYVVPLLVRVGGPEDAEAFGPLDAGGVPARVTDALGDPEFCRALLAGFADGLTLEARHGAIRFARGAAFPASAVAAGPGARRIATEQSNTSIVYDDVLILKVFRKLESGPNPEHEMTDFLTARARFAHVPQLAGAIEYARLDGAPVTLAVLHRFVPNRGDGWTWMLEHLRRLAGFVTTRAHHEPVEGERLGQLVRDFSAGLLGAVRQLGALTGGLHVALASDPCDPAFAPEPISAADVREWADRIVADLGLTLEALRGRLGALSQPAQERASSVLAGAEGLRACLDGLDVLRSADCHKIRIHGDYHLGQTLRTDDGFVILDFEGEPARTLAERRGKHCVLRDVAGMLRSFDYAAATALGGDAASRAAGEVWLRLAVDAFLDAYLAETERAPERLVPTTRPAVVRALAPFILDKALYEVRYEIDNRPAWVDVPLLGLDRLRSGRGQA